MAQSTGGPTLLGGGDGEQLEEVYSITAFEADLLRALDEAEE